MNRKSILVSAVALIMLLGFAIRPAIAYFTSYTESEGAQIIHLSNVPDIDEPEVKNWIKHLVITNKKDAKAAVYVRGRAFTGSQYELTYSGTGWSDGGDGFWYYKDPVEPGESADELLVKISKIPKDAKIGDGFNVAVIYEAVPVRYDKSGEPFADWSQDLILPEEE